MLSPLIIFGIRSACAASWRRETQELRSKEEAARPGLKIEDGLRRCLKQDAMDANRASLETRYIMRLFGAVALFSLGLLLATLLGGNLALDANNDGQAIVEAISPRS